MTFPSLRALGCLGATALALGLLPACRAVRPASPVAALPPAAAATPPASPRAAPAPATLAPAAPTAATPWTPQTPVGRIVAERPSTARVFERRGIDYCCGGSATLAEAAQAKGLDPRDVLADLSAAPAPTATGRDRSWADAPLGDLLAHIESTHHVYLREELPRLSTIVAKVREVHLAAHPEMDEVARTWSRLAAALPPHLVHEETTVFPAVRSVLGGQAGAGPGATAALERMRLEHDEAGAALHELRRLTNGFVPPADACALYRQMLLGFSELEADTHEHVHLENNVLLPRAAALAAR
jgi:regulator of cell morphogenesis and NO signaling